MESEILATAALRKILEHMRDGKRADAVSSLVALAEWLHTDGAMPDVGAIAIAKIRTEDGHRISIGVRT